MSFLAFMNTKEKPMFSEKEILDNFLKGTKCLAQMENLWRYKCNPGSSFSDECEKLRKTLEYCLSLNIEFKDKK